MMRTQRVVVSLLLVTRFSLFQCVDKKKSRDECFRVSDTLNKKSLKFRKSFQKARMPQNRDAREEDVTIKVNATTRNRRALKMAPNTNNPKSKANNTNNNNNALYKQKKGRIAKAFPKSYKNKAKSYEFMMMHREQQQQKMSDTDDDKNDDEDVAKEQDLMMKTSDDEKKKKDDDDDENDEKHYVLDLGEMQRRLASERNTTNTRRSNTTNKRVGYQSAKGKRGGGRTINQNANLADLDLADEETVRNALSSLPVSHYEERKRKAESLEMRYPEWFRYLTHDFSVLLYGFGSKKQVLEDFARRYLLDGAVVVVNGYQQRVSALAILNQCAFALSDESENLMHHSSNNNNGGSSNNGFADVANNAQALLRRIAELTTDHSGGGGEKTNENGDAMMMHNITNNTTTTTTTGGTAATKNTRGSRRDGGNGNNSAAALASLRDANVNASYERDKNHYQSTASFNDGGSASRLYLVVHNIDGVAMRNAETQSILGELSSFPRVHLIASVDHVNAPLLWSKREAAKFNWIYQKAVTFAPYAKETANDPQLLASKGEERHVRGAANVLKSLTRNARIIYRIIAEAQISENGQGLTFPQLFQLSRESFLVTAELALRGVLTEFTDHELIKIKKVSDNEDLITVPMDNNALEQLVEDECEEIHNFF